MWGFGLIFRFWLALGTVLRIKMFAIELREHGSHAQRSVLDRQSIESYVADVNDAINHEIGDCILLGWSMGGLISQFVASENKHVKKLVLVATASPAGILLRGPMVPKLIKQAYAWAILRGKSFSISYADARDLMFNFGFTEDECREFISELGPESGRAARDMVFSQILFWKASSLTITVPTLILAAGRDAITPVSLQRAIAERYAHAEYIQIDDASHAVMLQPKVREEAFKKIIQWGYEEQMPLLKAA